MVKIWGKEVEGEEQECNDPNCSTCGGSGFVAICRNCNKQLSEHSYEQQQKCMKQLET